MGATACTPTSAARVDGGAREQDVADEEREGIDALRE